MEVCALRLGMCWPFKTHWADLYKEKLDFFLMSVMAIFVLSIDKLNISNVTEGNGFVWNSSMCKTWITHL